MIQAKLVVSEFFIIKYLLTTKKNRLCCMIVERKILKDY